MVDMIEDRSDHPAGDEKRPAGVRHWAWTPWYAKAWWGLALLYWLLRGLSYKVDALSWMNEAGFAGYFVVAFFPPLMLFILAFGVLRARMNAAAANGLPTEDTEADIGHFDLFDQRRGPSGLPIDIDPLHPRSGALWIGNPLNPLNASYINRGS
ncbi:hypothetical protein WG907_06920 [Sphingobium sp. AN558]|uniref:hypothetical protein n=1 Tax=Sphingobium sp. AN558 TaxID=3133442 RepID=UPI0030BCDEDB